LTQIERNRKAIEKEEPSQCGSHYLVVLHLIPVS